ncbi:hypothetical protein RS9916_32002 [Synechococcus sp. RS9916]|nr:hypothetical protein RS9916_32002 [Synechococcus sp. RS9916]
MDGTPGNEPWPDNQLTHSPATQAGFFIACAHL